jgi:hypothetical protein
MIAAGAAMLLAGGGSAAYAITRDGDGNQHRYEHTAGAMEMPVEVQGGIGPSDENVQPLQGQAIIEPDLNVKMGGMVNHNALDDLAAQATPKPKKLHHAKPHSKKPTAK